MAEVKIAALFVQEGGVYTSLPCVDPWTEKRDARRYAGPHPVIAHPPCARWGRYASGGPSAKVRLTPGDDDGCFSAALNAVRAYYGVLEHPANSMAWEAFGLAPPCAAGWSRSDEFGWTCHVEQGHYGHRARKATWLYCVTRDGASPSELIWGASCPPEVEAIDRSSRRSVRRGVLERLSRRQRAATPVPFRDLLINIVISCCLG